MRKTALICAVAGMAALLLGACTPQPRFEREHYESKLQQLHGRSIDDVKRAWGPPDAVDSLSDGGQVVSFKRQMPGPLAPVLCTTFFEVDAKGIIKNHRYNGIGCRVRPLDDLGMGLQ